MPTKVIECNSCGLRLSKIRDATLRKGISYLCSDCEKFRLTSEQLISSVYKYNTAHNTTHKYKPIEQSVDEKPFSFAGWFKDILS